MTGMSDSISHTLSRLPRFNHIDYLTLEERLCALLDSHRTRVAQFTAKPEHATWSTIIEPMEAMADELHQLFGPVSHLHNVADNEALRASYKRCIALVSEYGSELAQHAGLFQCYGALREAPAYLDYPPAEQKLIDNALRDFRLGGVALDAPTQARVKTLKVELAQLATRFEENVLDATQSYKLEVNDERRLSGLPPSVLLLTRQNAARDGRPGDGQQRDGQQSHILTLDFPCYQPAMTYLHDRALREELYLAYVTRASDQGPHAGQNDNSTLMHELLGRRQELAHLLGFANYAELSLATKMAPSTDAVIAFLEELAAKAHAAATREYAELERYAQAHLAIESLCAWDLAYAGEKLREARYALRQEDLKPYFPIDRVVAGMFTVAARLFGVEFDRCEGVETWHPDVAFHAIRERSGQPIGYFFLDLYARERKRPGAWMDECLVRWRHDGTAQLPVAYLTCNFTPPVTATPTLLTHDEVITLFHEFGHGLHHLLTTVERPAVAGINGVPWDAVELPSQFMENWCWERQALDVISGHHASGEPLPEALFERLERAQYFQAAMQMLRQIEFALFDFRLHANYQPGTDIQSVLDAVRAQVAVVRPPSWNRFQHSFSHIFAGGYAAGYYSYKWAEVLAADAFSRFEEDGIFNADTGKAFRSIILANGGAEDAMDLFKRFRGRLPAVEPLLRQAGLGGERPR